MYYLVHFRIANNEFLIIFKELFFVCQSTFGVDISSSSIPLLFFIILSSFLFFYKNKHNKTPVRYMSWEYPQNLLPENTKILTSTPSQVLQSSKCTGHASYIMGYVVCKDSNLLYLFLAYGRILLEVHS